MKQDVKVSQQTQLLAEVKCCCQPLLALQQDWLTPGSSRIARAGGINGTQGFITAKRHENHTFLTLTAYSESSGICPFTTQNEANQYHYSILLKCSLITKEHTMTPAMGIKAGLTCPRERPAQGFKSGLCLLLALSHPQFILVRAAHKKILSFIKHSKNVEDSWGTCTAVKKPGKLLKTPH